MSGARGHQLQVGDVVLSHHKTPNGSWWLVDGPDPQTGVNSIHIAGEVPRGFKRGERTHWSDSVVKDQRATTNPPGVWPDEVCVALAAFALTGKVPHDVG